MRDDALVARVLEIGASGLRLLDRAQALVDGLQRWLPADAAWLTLTDPSGCVYAGVGGLGPTGPILAHPNRPEMADGPVPAGFREGLSVPLCDLSDRRVGTLTLLPVDLGSPPPSPAAGLHDRIRGIAPLIAQIVSPMRSPLASARLVDGATSGLVVLRDGGCWQLPGFEDHPLLVGDSAVTRIGRHSLVSGHVYRSFLWPVDGGPGAHGHARVTVLAANDAPDFVLGTVLVTPQVDCGGLTPRELEVLGLLVEGRSNQQIARGLMVAPRTVATHVEHILDKLQAPTRTVAAVHAEREGCHVPPLPPPPAEQSAGELGSVACAATAAAAAAAGWPR